MVDATSAQTALGQDLGAVLRSQQVVEGNADVVVTDVVVSGRVVHYLYARRVARHDEHAVGAHDEEDVGAATGAGEPLLTVDDPLLAVADGVGLEQVGVGPPLRLGHGVGREDLLVHEGVEPALLLLVGAVGRQHLHVAGVGRSGAEHDRRRSVPAKDLVDQGELELTEPRAAQLRVEEQGPKAAVLDLVLEGIHQRLDLGVPGPGRAWEHEVQRLDLGDAELLDPVELLLELRVGRKVPGHCYLRSALSTRLGGLHWVLGLSCASCSRPPTTRAT